MADNEQMVRTGVGAITGYLEGEGVAHEVVEHDLTMSAAEEARATHVAPERVAKTVVLHDGESYLLAVIPASQRLDLQKLRELFGSSRRLRLASEAEMGKQFPTIDVGAMPPIGPVLPAAEVVDRRLMDEDRILCAGGDHRHAIELDPRDLVRVTGARVADVCED